MVSNLRKGNVGIGTTSPGEKLTVTGTIESTTGGVKFPDGTLQTTAGGGGFGVWNDRNKDGNPDTVANNTVYQAATDGFVCAFTTTNQEINGYTDSSNTPTTRRQFFPFPYNDYGTSINFPVREGDYWRVTGATNVYWIPLGN